MDAPRDPFHAGERALQERAGVRERMASVGARVIRDHLPEQHREFFALLPFLVVGSVDAGGQPWASVLHGTAGFAQSPDPRHLRIDALPMPGTTLGDSLRVDAPLGLLGIQPHTRRRNRLNGHVRALDARGFLVEVDQSFGNCPQYIHRREPQVASRSDAPAIERLAGLDADAHALIANADTAFIASAHDGAVDVSHRGGEPGFVDVDAAGRLLLPDYRGNFFFNTLGNLLLSPRAGLLFLDFDSGDLLQVAGGAEVLLDGPELDARPEAQRLVRLDVTAATRIRGALPLRWRERTQEDVYLDLLAVNTAS